MTDDRGPATVGELAEYCRTQAGLLSGHVQMIGEEADELLDEIDEDIAGLRARLAGRGAPSADSPGPSGSGDREEAVANLEEAEADLEEKQAIVEAKQARMAAFQELAVGYTELAESLDATDDADPSEALERVVAFERDNDAPAYFEDRLTVYEAAAGATDE